MGVKWKTTKNEFPKMQQTLETLGERKVKIGVLEGESQWLAAIHEYGCNITVTPAMRAWLHSHGLHLSPNTTTIRIPERSFLRNGHDQHAESVLKKADMAVGQVINGKMSVEEFLDMVGQMLSDKIKDYATDLRTPPNHPFTIEQKGSSNPLADTGQMIEGITWRVE